jgi:hypothetical protein
MFDHGILLPVECTRRAGGSGWSEVAVEMRGYGRFVRHEPADALPMRTVHAHEAAPCTTGYH